MSSKREDADSLIGGVRDSMETVKTMTASGSTEGVAEALSIASVCAQTALVLAVQELTDAVKPHQRQIGWVHLHAKAAPDRSLFIHPHDFSGTAAGHEDCQPVWA